MLVLPINAVVEGVITAFIDSGESDDIGLFYMILVIPIISMVFKMLINKRDSY